MMPFAQPPNDRLERTSAAGVGMVIDARRSTECWAGKQGWRDGATDGGDADNRYTLRPAGYGPEARDAGSDVPATGLLATECRRV